MSYDLWLRLCETTQNCETVTLIRTYICMNEKVVGVIFRFTLSSYTNNKSSGYSRSLRV